MNRTWGPAVFAVVQPLARDGGGGGEVQGIRRTQQRICQDVAFETSSFSESFWVDLFLSFFARTGFHVGFIFVFVCFGYDLFEY